MKQYVVLTIYIACWIVGALILGSALVMGVFYPESNWVVMSIFGGALAFIGIVPLCWYDPSRISNE